GQPNRCTGTQESLSRRPSDPAGGRRGRLDMVLTIVQVRAGALIRKQVRQILQNARWNGLNATWVEDKGLFESVFYDIRVSGDEHSESRVTRQFQQFMDVYG